MLLLAALVLALASAGFWLVQLGYLQFTTPRPASPLSLSAEVDADNTPPSKLISSTPITAPVDSVPVVVAPLPESVPEHTDTMPPPGTILELWQLPASLRAGVPPLDFSLHVYSTRRDQRSIIINNRMMREGETINPELALSAITPDGVVMKYRSEYFRVSILDNW
jgi:hypothetical protein